MLIKTVEILKHESAGCNIQERVVDKIVYILKISKFKLLFLDIHETKQVWICEKYG